MGDKTRVKRTVDHEIKYEKASRNAAKTILLDKNIKKKKSESIKQYFAKYCKHLDTLSPPAMPTPRSNSSLTFIGENELFMFGGELFSDNNVVVYNDSYIFNLSTNSWNLVECTRKPGPRCSHQIVMHNDLLYMFGGEFATKNEYLHFNDLWSFSISNKIWNEVSTKGNAPSPRSGHKMATWNDNIILFGGFYDTNDVCKYHNDLYLFDIKKSAWIKLECLNEGPCPRSASLFAIKDNLLFIHGGYSKNNDVGTSHNDTWTIDLKHIASNGYKLFWEKRNISGDSPSASIGYGSCVHDGCIYVFGGIKDINSDLDSVFYNDLFTINPLNRKWVNLYRKNDLESLDSLKLNDKNSSVPIERGYSLIATNGKTIYVYGGIREFKDREFTLSCLWKFENNQWVCLIPCEIPEFDGEESDYSSDESSSKYNYSDGGGSTNSEYESGPSENYSEMDSSDSEFSDSESNNSNDSMGNIVVKKGEKLRDFYQRTMEHWIQSVTEENLSEKDIKKIAFENCKNYYQQ